MPIKCCQTEHVCSAYQNVVTLSLSKGAYQNVVTLSLSNGAYQNVVILSLSKGAYQNVVSRESHMYRYNPEVERAKARCYLINKTVPLRKRGVPASVFPVTKYTYTPAVAGSP